MLKAVKKTRVYEDIVTQVKALIAEGELRSGDQLPSERELSEKFQVSRASVREAIRALESMHLINSRPGEGTYIAASVETIVGPLASAILQQKDALLDIFEARKIVEPEIAALAAERATEHDVTQLQAILKKQQEEIATGGTGIEVDTTFHSALAHAAKNVLLLKLNDSIVDSLRETRERSLQGRGRREKSLAGHREIMRAIRQRDPKAARQAMLTHLEAIEHNVLQSETDSGKGGRHHTEQAEQDVATVQERETTFDFVLQEERG